MTELPVLEKALTQGDFARQKSSLEQILKALRPMRLKSLEGLELGTRGKLLTTLVRVQRQPRPAGVDALASAAAPAAPAAPETTAPEAPAAEETPTAETGSAGEAAPEVTGADTPPEAPAGEASGEEAATAAAEGAPTEPNPAAEAAGGETAAAAAEADPEREKAQGYQEVLVLVGRIWRSVGESDRASTAFELSGKPAPAEDAHEAESGAEARGDRPDRGERGAKRERGERPPRGDRPERGERGERGARADRPGREDRRQQKEPLNIPFGGNWEDVAKEWEAAGRTRDAARAHEKNGSWAEAARLFAASGNSREALRCAVASKDDALIRQVLAEVKVEDARPVLEKAQAWELLMEKCVAAGDWETVAKLYERARQFDQAGLAWERAGKLSLARKSFERVRDFKSVQRLRNLEVERLIERGDRMGAAQLLVQSRRKDEAVAVLLPLPAAKAYRFMERLKLEEAAKALARRELEKATTENKPASMARWLELLDESALAAEAWEGANRLDKASVCNERAGNLKLAAEQAERVGDLDRAQDLFRRAGDTENMERVAALPRLSAEERKKRGPSAEQEAEDREHDDARAEAAATPDAPAEGATEAAEEANGGEAERAAPVPGTPEVSGPPGEPSGSVEEQ